MLETKTFRFRFSKVSRFVLEMAEQNGLEIKSIIREDEEEKTEFLMTFTGHVEDALGFVSDVASRGIKVGIAGID